jgi:small subunit ribosomal protein S1
LNSAPYDQAPSETEDEGLQDMGSLLEEESMEPRSIRRGEIVEGTIVTVSKDAIIVDIGSKSEALIPASEMHSLGADPSTRVHSGDEVLVYVMQNDPNEGHLLVSIDKARGEQGWRVLQDRFQSGEAFEAEVTGHNKGGLLVNVEGVNGFLPLSQIVSAHEGEAGLGQLVGKPIRLKVIELNRKRNRAILSERVAMQEWRSSQKDRLLDELNEGEIRTGTVSSVRDFGVFVDLGGADGLVHLSELSWDRQKSPQAAFELGQEVDVFVLKVDKEQKKIALSMRRAQPQQWESLADTFHVGDVVYGRVTKVVAFGAFVRLEGAIEGLIHVSELADRRINHPHDVVKEGDIVPVKIVRIERDRHRLGLSLRGARDEAERVGFRFNDQGGILRVPDHVLEQFGEQPRRPDPEAVTVEEDFDDDVETSAFAQAMARATAGRGEAPMDEGDAEGSE